MDKEIKENPFNVISLLSKFFYYRINDIDLVFHYTNKQAESSIIKKDKLIFRHSKHSLDDKEYRCIDIECFYARAIKELVEEKGIDCSNIKERFISNKYLFYRNGRFLEGEAYISCFSIVNPKNGDYLFKKFCKGNEKDRVALGLYLENLKESTYKAYDKKYLHFIMPLVYGDRASIDFIKQFVIKLIEATSDHKYQIYAVQTFLNICRFIFKPLCYDDEHEIRSIVIYPIEELEKEYKKSLDKDVFIKRDICFDLCCFEKSYY